MTKKKPPPPQAKPAMAVANGNGKDWYSCAKDIVIIGSVLSALGLGTIISFSRGLIDSGPLPVPSRAEVTAVADTVAEIRASEEAAHERLTTQLDAQAKVSSGILEQQRQQLADTRTSRLRSLQSGLDAARGNVVKEPTVANERIVKALQAQLETLQDDIMKAASK